MNKNHIVFLAFSGISIRNLFTYNENLIKKISSQYKISIITKNEYKDLLPSEIYFININKFKLNFLDKIFYQLSSFSFYKNFHTKSHEILLEKPFFKGKFNFLKIFIMKIFPKSKYISSLIRNIHNYMIKILHKKNINTLKKIRPSYLIALNPLSKREGIVLEMCKKICSTSGIIKSFDNITTNGFMPSIPNKLFVWNKFMKKSAYEAYEVNPKNIFCVGSSQYDFLINKNKKNRNNNLNNNKRNILYCTNSNELYPGDRSNIDFLLDFAETFNFYITLRFHQSDNEERWLNLKKHPRLIISNYDSFKFKSSEVRISLKQHLENLNTDIKNSLFTISSYSTLIYDSLSRNKPAINLGFDPPGKQHKYPVKRLENFEHIIPMLKCKFVINTYNQNDLLKKIIFLLENYTEFVNKHINDKEVFISQHLASNKKDKTLKKILKHIGIKFN